MAEPIDFNAHRLAVLNKLPTRKADAFRGTGDNHIAWVERVQRRAKFNELGHGENQVIGVIVLFEYTIQAGAYARMVTEGRSEERRVGKECRARWWREQGRGTRRTWRSYKGLVAG